MDKILPVQASVRTRVFQFPTPDSKQSWCHTCVTKATGNKETHVATGSLLARHVSQNDSFWVQSQALSQDLRWKARGMNQQLESRGPEFGSQKPHWVAHRLSYVTAAPRDPVLPFVLTYEHTWLKYRNRSLRQTVRLRSDCRGISFQWPTRPFLFQFPLCEKSFPQILHKFLASFWCCYCWSLGGP